MVRLSVIERPQSVFLQPPDADVAEFQRLALRMERDRPDGRLALKLERCPVLYRRDFVARDLPFEVIPLTRRVRKTKVDFPVDLPIYTLTV